MATVHAAQKVIREKGQTTCVYHKEQTLIMYCETCSDVMCMKCLSGLHKGHFVCDLNDVIPSMKTELRSYLNKNNRGHIQKGIESTETEMKKNASNFDSLCREVKNQREKLKFEIDVKAEKVLEICKQMEEGNIKTLTSFRRELQSRLGNFDDNAQQEYTKILEDGSNLQIHDTLNEVRSRATLPLMPTLEMARFHPHTNPQSYMDRYFGTITASAYRPLQYTFLPKTKEVSTFDLSKQAAHIRAICVSSKDEAWVCQLYKSSNYFDSCSSSIQLSTCFDSCSSSIQLINTNGDVLQTIPWELPIIDASVSPTTKNLWVCSDHYVYELDVSLKSSASLLKTAPTFQDINIMCICVTMDDQVIVGGGLAITKYTKDGRAVITTQPRQSGQPLVPSPTKITECPVTRNVAAIRSNSAVVVMDQKFEEIVVRSTQISEDVKYLKMKDLQYDTAGNIIICYDKTILHVLSGRGELLKTIRTQSLSQMNYLMVISLDTDGVLWIGYAREGNQNAVKRLQYCKQNDE